MKIGNTCEFQQVFVVQFEQLVRNRVEVSERMLNSVGLELEAQTDSFLNQSGGSHSESYYSVYKNAEVATKWNAELDPYIAAEIYADLEGTRLERFLDESN